jgi:hypothetical protein
MRIESCTLAGTASSAVEERRAGALSGATNANSSRESLQNGMHRPIKVPVSCRDNATDVHQIVDSSSTIFQRHSEPSTPRIGVGKATGSFKREHGDRTRCLYAATPLLGVLALAARAC